MDDRSIFSHGERMVAAELRDGVDPVTIADERDTSISEKIGRAHV